MLAFLLLAAAAHASNPIQIENAKPGTTSWQRSPWTSNHEIEGYASATSVTRGQTINLYVSTGTSGASYVIEVYRIGWYGGAGGRLVYTSPTLTGVKQTTPSADGTGLIECNWTNPYALAIPADWVSGIYLAKLTLSSNPDYQNTIIFVVRDDDRAPASDYLYQAAVNTWQAYNNWGGKSLYPFNSDGGIQAQQVSFNRPYFADSGGMGDFTIAELNLVRFLEKEGYDVSYATNVDLHEQGAALIAPHKAFLSAGHDEYWSYQMKSAAQQARDQGKHLFFFGSNAVYWQARFAPSTVSGAANRTLVSYKEAAEFADPYYLGGVTANYKYVTTRFRDLVAPPYNVVDDVAQPENGLVGIMYHGDPFNGDIVVSNAAHWAFDNTGLSNGSHLAGMLGYENDSVFTNGYSPATLTVLANSPDGFDVPGSPDTPNYANTTVYTAPSGALVFATGSIQWSWGLDDYGVNPLWTKPSDWGRASRLSEAAKQVTRNVLNRFAIVKPGAPRNPLAVRGNGQATVAFDPPASDGGGAVSGYTVISNPPGGTDANAGSSALIHAVTGLSNGTPYTFTITATNVAGTGPASAPSNSITPSTDPAVPGQPTGVTALAGGAQAAVSFSPPASDGGAAIDGYTVFSNPPGGVDVHAGTTLLTHVVTGLTNGVSYRFTVTAHNPAGTGFASLPSAPVTPASVPGKPAVGAVAAGNAQATVYFSIPADDGGRPITGYTVASNPENRTSVCLASPCTVTGLGNGMSYEFRVAASNSFGLGAWSDPSARTVPMAATTAPSVASAAPLLAARRNHSATLLNSGKLLVAGGIGATGSYLASAELYDPATNSWVLTGAPAAARSAHSATLLPNGKVLVVGGQNGAVLASAELYDPVANSWSSAGSLTTARCAHSATLLGNGKVLVAGGQNCVPYPGPTALYSSAELYDPATNSWSAAGTMNAAHESHLAALLPNGKVLIVGNWWQDAHAELYDPAGNSWSSAADLPSGQYGAAGALLANGKVLFAGGWASASFLTSARLYDPASNSWSAAASMLSTREWHTATPLLNGKALVAGGIANDAGNLAPTELYDPAANAWSAALPLATGRIYHSATRLANGKVAIVGGQSGGTLSSVEIYDAGSALAIPAPPRAVSAVAGNGQASVSFTAPYDNGGSAITGYTVQSNPPGGIDQQAGSMSLVHTIGGLANGTAYTFTVSAANGIGSGNPSAPSNSVTPAAAPLVVTGAASAITATGARLAGSVTARGAAAALAFDYGPGAGYGSVAAATPSSTTALYAGNVSASLAALSCNTTYHYRLRAASSAGNADGADATFSTSPCGPTAPGAPAIVAVAPGAGRATVSFEPPASFGSSPVISYTVTCAANGRAPRSATGAASPITVTGLAGNVAYRCTVAANNGVGSGAASAALLVTPSGGGGNLAAILLLLLD